MGDGGQGAGKHVLLHYNLWVIHLSVHVSIPPPRSVRINANFEDVSSNLTANVDFRVRLCSVTTIWRFWTFFWFYSILHDTL